MTDRKRIMNNRILLRLFPHIERIFAVMDPLCHNRYLKEHLICSAVSFVNSIVFHILNENTVSCRGPTTTFSNKKSKMARLDVQFYTVLSWPNCILHSLQGTGFKTIIGSLPYNVTQLSFETFLVFWSENAMDQCCQKSVHRCYYVLNRVIKLNYVRSSHF